MNTIGSCLLAYVICLALYNLLAIYAEKAWNQALIFSQNEIAQKSNHFLALGGPNLSKCKVYN